MGEENVYSDVPDEFDGFCSMAIVVWFRIVRAEGVPESVKVGPVSSVECHLDYACPVDWSVWGK